MAIPITQKAKGHFGNKTHHPIIEKNLEDDVVAEANNDGTIYVNEKASPAKKAEAVEHEKVHMDQIERGDINYDD